MAQAGWVVCGKWLFRYLVGIVLLCSDWYLLMY
jgi:hypothetical protein